MRAAVQNRRARRACAEEEATGLPDAASANGAPKPRGNIAKATIEARVKEILCVWEVGICRAFREAPTGVEPV